MRLKRLLAVLLSLTVLIGLVPVAGMVMGGAAATSATYYLAAAAVGTGDGSSADNADAADADGWAAAQTAVNAVDVGTIKLVGTDTITLPGRFQNGCGALTIEGNDPATKANVLLSGKVDVLVDLTLDNMLLAVPDVSNPGTANYFAFWKNTKTTERKQGLTTGPNFQSGVVSGKLGDAQSTANGPNIFMNFDGNASEKMTLNLKAGHFREIIIGSINGKTKADFAGMDITVDGATIGALNLDARGQKTQNIKHTEDINILLKSGSVGKIYGPITRTSGTGVTFDTGKAIRIIQSDAFTCADAVPTKDLYGGASTLSASLPFYKVVVPAALMSKIGFGADGGVFSVAKKTALNATKTTAMDNQAVSGATPIASVATSLTLTEAGAYAITEGTYVPTTATFYLAATAAGTGDGSSADNASADWAAAQAAMNNIDKGTIKLVGTETITLPSRIQNSCGALTIEGNDPATKANVLISGKVDVLVDLTLDNMILAVPDVGNPGVDNYFAFWKNTKTDERLQGLTTGSKFKSGVTVANMAADPSIGNGPNIYLNFDCNTTEKVTINLNGGAFREIIVGATDKNHEGPITIQGLDVNIWAANVGTLNLDARGGKKQTIVSDDINVLLKSGSLNAICGPRDRDAGKGTFSFAAGKSIRVIQASDFVYEVKSIPAKDLYGGNSTVGLTLPYRKIVVPADDFAKFAMGTGATFAVDSTDTYEATKVFGMDNQAVTGATPIESVSGVLTLADAGVYTVAKKATTPTPGTGDATYYLAKEAAGTGDGSSAANADAADADGWAAALAAGAGKANLTIKLVGNGVTLPGTLAAPVGAKLLVEGNDAEPAQVNLLAPECIIEGNVTLDNMKVGIASAGSGFFDMKSMTENPTTFTTGTKFSSGYLNFDFAATPAIGSSPAIMFSPKGETVNTAPATVILHGGMFREITIGSYDQPATIPGLTFVVDGEDVVFGEIEFGNRSTSANGNAKYTGDINIQLLKGTFKTSNGDKYFCVSRGDVGTTTENDAKIVVVQSAAVAGLPIESAPVKSYFDAPAGQTNNWNVPFYKFYIPADMMEDVRVEDLVATMADPADGAVVTRKYDAKGVATTGATGVDTDATGKFTATETGIYEFVWKNPADHTPDGPTVASPTTEDNVFRINFSDYDWTESYLTYVSEYIRTRSNPAIGDSVTLSFDYMTTGSNEIRVKNNMKTSANSANTWSDDPEVNYAVIHQAGEAPKKGHFEVTFVANGYDIMNGDIEAVIQTVAEDQEDPKFYDFYYWNLTMTFNGSSNKIADPSEDGTGGLDYDYNGWGEMVDIDPATLVPPTDWGQGGDEGDDGDDDIVIPGTPDDGDTDTTPDTGDGDGEGGSGDEPVFEEPDLIDDFTGVNIKFENGAAEGAELEIGEYGDSDLPEDVLALLADKTYKAYEIAVTVDGEAIELDGKVRIGLPVPAGADESKLFIYYMDAAGKLFSVALNAEDIVDGVAYFETHVLGAYFIVEGDLGITDTLQPDAGEEKPDDKPADGDDVVVDGGDDAEGEGDDVSPDTGDSVVGVVAAIALLTAAAAALVISKKRAL